MNPNNFKELIEHFKAKLTANAKIQKGRLQELDTLLNEVNRFRQIAGRIPATLEQLTALESLACEFSDRSSPLALYCADLVQQ